MSVIHHVFAAIQVFRLQRLNEDLVGPVRYEDLQLVQACFRVQPTHIRSDLQFCVHRHRRCTRLSRNHDLSVHGIEVDSAMARDRHALGKVPVDNVGGFVGPEPGPFAGPVAGIDGKVTPADATAGREQGKCSDHPCDM
jgi:hypothetical protein